MINKKDANVPAKFRTDSPYMSLQSAVNELFSDFWQEWPSHLSQNRSMAQAQFMPRVDIRESEADYSVTAEIPGIDPRDIELTLMPDHLVMKGEKRFEKEEGNSDKDSHYLERSYGSFSRTIPFATEVDLERTSVKSDRGVLKINLPKSKSAKLNSRKLTVS
jgi:HSP20 family protein